MDPKQDLAIQSWCFRNFPDNREVIAMLRDCGVSAIELCGKHVDFARPETFDEVIGLYHEAGIRIVSIGVNGFANRPDSERNLFEFARKAGLTAMSADFDLKTFPDCLHTAERLADEYRVNLAIHNHGGRHWLGCPAVIDWVLAQAGPRIGLCLDTAWALHSHADPVQMAEQFGRRLFGVHVKDFVFDRAGKGQDVVVGTGNLDLPALLATLETVGFDGYTVLEYEADADNPVPALTACVQAIAEA